MIGMLNRQDDYDSVHVKQLYGSNSKPLPVHVKDLFNPQSLVLKARAPNVPYVMLADAPLLLP